MNSAQHPSDLLGISGKSLNTAEFRNSINELPDALDEKSSIPQAREVWLPADVTKKTLRFNLQRRAGTVLYDPALPKERQHPTCWCYRGVARASDTVSILGKRNEKSVRMDGSTTCKNVWTCPVCSGRICRKRQRQLARAMKAHVANGGHVYLLTLTFPHELRARPLADMVDRLIDARTKFKNCRTYKSILGKGVRLGSVSSLENTYGDEHGWHPHNHDLVFTTPDAFGVEKLPEQELTDHERAVGKVKMVVGEKGKLSSRLIDELKAAWFHCLLKAGLCIPSDRNKVLMRGLDVRGGLKAAEYIAKFGRDEKWGMSREATMHAAKLGMKNEGEYHGAHPFQLLTWAEEGDGQAIELFREYVEAFRSKRMLSWSPGLKKALLGEDEESDEQLCDGTDDEDEPEIELGTIGSEELSVLHKRRLLPNFIGFVIAYVLDSPSPREDIAEYIAWARTVPVNSRGEVKRKMWTRSKGVGLDGRKNDGFSYLDYEQGECEHG